MKSLVIWAKNLVPPPRNLKISRWMSWVPPCRPPSTANWVNSRLLSLLVWFRPRCPVVSISRPSASTWRQGGVWVPADRTVFFFSASPWSPPPVSGPKPMQRPTLMMPRTSMLPMPVLACQPRRPVVTRELVPEACSWTLPPWMP